MVRPDVSDDVEERVIEKTEDAFNVPKARVSFDDRLRVLLDQYDDLEGQVQSREQIKAELEGSFK
jgi:hypothetical protein